MYRTEIYSVEHGGIATCDWTPENLGNGVTGTYREANAYLIASAPELLAALQHYVRHDRLMNIGGFMNAKALDAIAKATGGTP